jgi:hypothetical protein
VVGGDAGEVEVEESKEARFQTSVHCYIVIQKVGFRLFDCCVQKTERDITALNTRRFGGNSSWQSSAQ